MTSQPFLLGLLVGVLSGALLSGIPAWHSSDSDGPVPDAGAVAPGEGGGQIPPPAAREPGVQPPPAGGPRAESRTAWTPAAVDAAAPAAAPAPAGVERLPELRAELRQLIEAGALEKGLREPRNILHFLVDAWLQAEEPGRAVALLSRFEMDETLAQHSIIAIGKLTAEGGDRAQALEACLLVARSGHARNELVHHATQLDPGRVLAELDVAAAAAGDWGSDWPPQRSLLLLAAGQTAAALDIIDACLGDPSSPALLPPFWDALVRRAPQEAETRLRAQLDATEDEDSKLALGRSLAMALGSQGKKAEAVALLGDLLQTGLGDEALVNTFREVDPEALRSWLCKRVAAKPDAHALDLYGDALMAAKQSGDAVAAWWRAVELQPGSAAAYKLIQHVPAQAAARLAELARLRRDDELCGDIADALWQLGERRRAENLWRQASELDASDEEWANKLRRVWEGRNPLE